MKKRIFLLIIGVLLLFCVAVTFIPIVSHADDSSIEEIVSNSIIEETFSETTNELESEISQEVIDIIKNAEDKSDAIISLAEKLGITTEEAERIINTVIEIGDEYVGDSAWWISFKNNVQSDIQFWTTAIVLIVAVLAIIGGVFVLLAKTNPTMKKAMWGMSESLKVNNQIKNENSQTLGEMKKIFEESAKEKAAFEKLIEEKEEYIKTLELKMKDLEEAASIKSANMVKAEMYNLRMLKLICDRTAMPLTDKSTIDLFYAKGIDALKAELSSEDIEKIEKTMSMLDSVGGDMA